MTRHDDQVEPWPQVDDLILAGQILPAIQMIRAETSRGLREAIDVFGDRFSMLRATCPEDFAVSLESYGEGFYS